MITLLDLDMVFDPDRVEAAVGRGDRYFVPAELPVEWHVLWDERAAIMEYEGRLCREHAEAEALKDILRQMTAVGIRPGVMRNQLST